MDNLNDFLSAASKDRKKQMELAKEMQDQRERRKREKDRLALKECRALADVIGKELAWEQLFQEPFPTSSLQTTHTTVTDADTNLLAHIGSTSQSHGFLLDPAIKDLETDNFVHANTAASAADSVSDGKP
jgi:hypothetical protein